MSISTNSLQTYPGTLLALSTGGGPKEKMMLKPREKERLRDCLLMIQSARSILSGIREADFPQLSEIERCFRNADEVITRLLRN